MSDTGFKILKFVVHAVGVILILGIIFIFAVVYQRSTAPKDVVHTTKAEPSKEPIKEKVIEYILQEPKSEPANTPAEVQCVEDGSLKIPIAGKVKSVAVYGTKYVAVIENSDSFHHNDEIVVIDFCANKLLHRAPLE